MVNSPLKISMPLRSQKLTWDWRTLVVFMQLNWLCLGLLAAATAANASQITKPEKLTVFTHGDTIHAQFEPDGSITGIATTLLDCAAEKTGVPYRYRRAPLSRASSIVESSPDTVWFPSAHRGDASRMSRMIGPVTDVKFIWYQLKTNTANPNSEAFKANAKVTAYHGSALAETLRTEGYNMMPGSADHNRLIYMVMAGEVDALLAIDFRAVLKPETRRLVEERMQMTMRSSVPISFLASKPLLASYPAFFNELKTALMSCKP